MQIFPTAWHEEVWSKQALFQHDFTQLHHDGDLINQSALTTVFPLQIYERDTSTKQRAGIYLPRETVKGRPETKHKTQSQISDPLCVILLSNMWCGAGWEQLEVKSGCFSCLPSHLVSRLSLSQSLKVNKKSLNIHRQWAPCSSQAGSTDGQHLGLI